MRVKKIPKIPDEIRVELASEIAAALTEVFADGRIRLWVRGPSGEEVYSDEAQKVFNRFYDRAHELVNDVFGSEWIRG